MSTDTGTTDQIEHGPETEPQSQAQSQGETPPFDDSVEVRRDGPLAAAVGLVAAAVALAYLVRAVGSGGALDWLLCLVMAGVAAVYLAALLDARSPLMVIDHHGVRVRRGQEWEGVAWPEVQRVEHRPRTSVLKDGRLAVHDTTDRDLGVRLSLSTRLIGADWDELSGALSDLTEGRVTVVEPDAPVPPAPESSVAEPEEELPEPVDADHTQPIGAVIPSREPVSGRRSEVALEHPSAPRTLAAPDPDVVFDQSADAVAPAEPEPVVVEPVIGPVLAAARTRIGLTVEQLAERTRIRPHVIEAVEVDDFAPCGGDFYARGHLRTLARVLGVDVEPLLDLYAERYADAPIDPKRIFEAELATGTHGSIRSFRGGLNWSVLVAAVMAVVLVWSVARLVMHHPAPTSQRPVLTGSPNNGQASLSSSRTKVPVQLTAATGGAKVIVRDGAGKVVFENDLPFMGTANLQVVPPVRISSTDGGLTVSLDGADKGAIGSTGQRAERTYVP